MAIYNAFSDKTIFLGKHAFQNLSISEMTPSLYDVMIREHFIVHDECDETKEYIHGVIAEEQTNNQVHLLINPTIDCNFRCWYCYESHKKTQMSEDIMLRIKRLISDSFSKGKEIQISWFGGEPMIFFREVIIPILEFTKIEACKRHRKFYTNMTSNGFLFSVNRIKELLKYNFNGVQITLDGNKEQHNRVRYSKNGKGSFDTIIENVKKLALNSVPITLRINCTETNVGGLSDVAYLFDDLPEEFKQYINVDLQIVWQEKNVEYIKSHLGNIVECFSKVGITAAKMSYRDFCYGDKRNSCVVNYNGDIYKCTAVDFETTERDGCLDQQGNIVWENGKLEKRMASRFTNPPCHSCRILPLCHGGCTRHTLNNAPGYCLYGFDENAKDRVVLDRIEYNITHGAKNKTL